jgi:small subunit ribosomal protein S3
MGQKVHPTGFRLGIATDWTSKWYADSSQFADFLDEDLKIREFLKKKLAQAAISRIQISRPAKSVSVTIHTAHRTTKHNAAFQLRSDAFSNQLGI